MQKVGDAADGEEFLAIAAVQNVGDAGVGAACGAHQHDRRVAFVRYQELLAEKNAPKLPAQIKFTVPAKHVMGSHPPDVWMPSDRCLEMDARLVELKAMTRRFAVHCYIESYMETHAEGEYAQFVQRQWEAAGYQYEAKEITSRNFLQRASYDAVKLSKYLQSEPLQIMAPGRATRP